ncbi:MAG: OsmC family protein [Chitinophagales bacterium]|nr:OsmC family protein [Chitinophagaceae bacterium]MCB9064545.1 OsmC family protein [Chitinophagales bacterium]
MTSKVIYKGNLRTVATHLRSGSEVETDAPIDNNGKGERFSPTDLMATALASCMCTMMGIAGNTHNIEVRDIECEVEKIMVPNPRRIGEVKVTLHFPKDLIYTDKEKTILERTAMTCPVLESMHPDLKKTVEFDWL